MPVWLKSRNISWEWYTGTEDKNRQASWQVTRKSAEGIDWSGKNKLPMKHVS
jgi:hypothetical protein